MPYDQHFFAYIRATSQQSATIVVGHLLSLFRPASVVDIGCARGDWLKAFIGEGVVDALGLDGEYLDRADLSIPRDRFRAVDLTKPLLLERRFELAVCLEVAEHLPESEAKRFVRDLTRISDLTLFSAAIPGQGGTGHVNEQWQDYWRKLFAAENRVPCDCIRPRIWGDDQVSWWFRQNIILYGTSEALIRHGLSATTARSLNLVAPELYVKTKAQPSFTMLLRRLPTAFRAAMKNRLGLTRHASTDEAR